MSFSMRESRSLFLVLAPWDSHEEKKKSTEFKIAWLAVLPI